MRFGGIVLAALLLALGACAGDPKPIEPTASSATPTPTPPAPTMPAQAKQNTPEGAAAFVKHYIDIFNHASNTGDTQELSRLSSPDCEGCQSYITLYKDTYAAGGYFKGSDWTLGPIDLEFGGDESYATTHVTTPVGTYRLTSKSAEKRGNSEDSDIAFAIARSGAGWQVTQLGLGEVR